MTNKPVWQQHQEVIQKKDRTVPSTILEMLYAGKVPKEDRRVAKK